MPVFHNQFPPDFSTIWAADTKNVRCADMRCTMSTYLLLYHFLCFGENIDAHFFFRKLDNLLESILYSLFQPIQNTHNSIIIVSPHTFSPIAVTPIKCHALSQHSSDQHRFPLKSKSVFPNPVQWNPPLFQFFLILLFLYLF